MSWQSDPATGCGFFALALVAIAVLGVAYLAVHLVPR